MKLKRAESAPGGLLTPAKRFTSGNRGRIREFMECGGKRLLRTCIRCLGSRFAFAYPFPLTPTLSLGERERPCARVRRLGERWFAGRSEEQTSELQSLTKLV